LQLIAELHTHMRIVLLYCLFVICIASCKKTGAEADNDIDLSTGTWRISYFWDEQDKTTTYSSYYFMFLSDGTFMAHSNTNLVTGTWSQTSTRININFSSSPMNDLNGDWLKTELKSGSIKLKDDGASQDDQLYFAKN
jgi:hypothetical protein